MYLYRESYKFILQAVEQFCTITANRPMNNLADDGMMLVDLPKNHTILLHQTCIELVSLTYIVYARFRNRLYVRGLMFHGAVKYCWKKFIRGSRTA